MDSTSPLQEPHPVQTGCVTGTTQGISDRFGAFGPVMESCRCSSVNLSLLYPADAEQCMNTKHITPGSLHLFPHKLCWFFSPPAFNPPLGGTITDQANGFHSDPVSKDVHAQ